MTQVLSCKDEFFRLELEGGMVLVMLASQARADTTLVRARALHLDVCPEPLTNEGQCGNITVPLMRLSLIEIL